MKTASNELQKLRSMAEASLDMSSELQQVLAKLEAIFDRTENQKVHKYSKTNHLKNNKFYSKIFIKWILNSC